MPSESRREFHVAPWGDDSSPGTAELPFATLRRAQEAVRTMTAGMDGDLLVSLHGGTHVLTEPLALSDAAGDSGRNGHRVIYQARRWGTPAPEPAVLSGGRTLTGWELDDVARGVWRAEVGDLDTRQLYVDGRRARRCRLDLGPFGGLPGNVTETDEGYVTDSTEPQSWENPGDIELVYLAQPGTWFFYSEPRCGVAAISGDEQWTAITMDQPCYRWFRQNHQGTFKPELLRPGPPTHVENSRSFLTEPGTFCLDRSSPGAHLLYYIPREGEDLSAAEVVAPVLEQLVDGRGEPGAPIHDVTFRGLTFTYATWLGPSEPTGFSHVFGPIYEGGDTPHFDDPYDLSESAQTMPGNVRFHHAERIVLEDNRFVRLGSQALELSMGSSENVVRGNVFTDVSGGGIEVGNRHPDTDLDRVNRDNVIENNLVHRVGVEYQGSVGIYLEMTQRARVAHNQIDSLPYIGIVLGEFWTRHEDGETTAFGNQILNNRVFDVMNALWDGGGIWTAASQGTSFEDGALVSGNLVHDTAPPPPGPPFPPGQELGFQLGYGLMIDDFSHYITWRENVAYRNGAASISCGPELHQRVAGNYWDDNSPFEDFGCTAPGSVFAAGDNTTLEGDPEQACADLPECAAIVAAAGLEPRYRHLLSERAQDRTRVR
jgi:Right handed beta helix region